MRRVAIVLAIITLILGIRFGTFVASGADSYGYVSQADLWLRHSLVVDQPLGRDAPWPDATWTLAPLGYRPGDQRGTMVPTYSPGLPMLMAVFKAILQQRGVLHSAAVAAPLRPLTAEEIAAVGAELPTLPRLASVA